jgi:hypothetical protein
MCASYPVQASAFLGMSLPAISGPVSAFSGSPFAKAASASRSSECPLWVLGFGL